MAECHPKKGQAEIIGNGFANNSDLGQDKRSAPEDGLFYFLTIIIGRVFVILMTIYFQCRGKCYFVARSIVSINISFLLVILYLK